MNLTKKQQIQILLIAIFMLVLSWQLYQLFSSPEPVPNAPAKKAAENVAVNNPAKTAAQVPANVPAARRAASALPPASATELEYARLANEYQIIQMQRMIAESYEAIAVAKRNTAKAMAETAQITGGGIAAAGTGELEAARYSGDYELIYTGQEGGQWTATLRRNNQTFDVVPNTVLGNMKVVSIDDNGVTVMQGNTRKTITFNGIQTEETAQNAVNSTLPQEKTPVIPAPAIPAIKPVHPVKPVSLGSAKPVDNQQKLLPAVEPKPVQTVAAPAPLAPAHQQNSVKSNNLPVKPAPVAAQVNVKPVAVPAPSPAKPAVAAKEVKFEMPPAHPVTTAAAPKQPVAQKTLPKIELRNNAAALANEKNDLQKLAALTKAAPPAKSAKPAAGVSEKLPAAVTGQHNIAKLNGAHYTVQLLADTDVKTLQQFAKHHHLTDNIMFAKIKKNNRDWHILLYGDYSDYATANKVLSNLSSKVSDTKPFIRKISSVQKAAG